MSSWPSRGRSCRSRSTIVQLRYLGKQEKGEGILVPRRWVGDSPGQDLNWREGWRQCPVSRRALPPADGGGRAPLPWFCVEEPHRGGQGRLHRWNAAHRRLPHRSAAPPESRARTPAPPECHAQRPAPPMPPGCLAASTTGSPRRLLRMPVQLLRPRRCLFLRARDPAASDPAKQVRLRAGGKSEPRTRAWLREGRAGRRAGRRFHLPRTRVQGRGLARD